jgi:hypothetical protein
MLEVIACTSGAAGGWHVLFFSKQPKPIRDWTDYLGKVAAAIGANVGAPDQDGDCELRPNETAQRPLGLRAPGSLNPKDASFGMIAFNSFTPRLTEWRSLLPSHLRTTFGRGVLAKTELSLLANISPQPLIKKQIALSERGFLQSVCEHYAIKAPRTRHKRMVQMVGALFNQCARSVALKAVALQYKQARPQPQSPLKDHLAGFARAWAYNEKKYLRKLSQAERKAFQCLGDRDREGFRVLRNWSSVGSDEFGAHCVTLAARLGVNGMSASRTRKRFCDLGIMRKTANYSRPEHRSTCYEWLLKTSSHKVNTNGTHPL